MRNFPVLGFPSSCGDVQALWLCCCCLFSFCFVFAKTGFLMMRLINNFISDVKCALHAWVLQIMQ